MTTIPPGTRFGPYEIVALAGSGGMGEVYKARDTRLDRTVAIKILPRDFAADDDRRSRFEREARIVASLSHPHICALHDVGSEVLAPGREPIAYLVMEHLDGTTLADRLARGPLPPDQVTSIGRDIAAALDAAHRQHVVHRDLKPGNVMLTRSGPKLLDFGLAKSVPTDHERTSVLASTALGDVTIAGTVLGTLAYMAPEQVEGRPSDHRSDIFALGTVIYEMATGRRAFPGDGPASVMAAIVKTDPPAIEGAPDLDRIVRGCLDKDPDQRWQSAHDVARQLAAVSPRDRRPESIRRRAWVPWTIAAASLVVASIALIPIGRDDRHPVQPATVSFGIPPPPGGRFLLHVEYTSTAVSPDGTRVAFSAADEKGPRIWIRSLPELQARPLEGTENGTSMFWSPDGHRLAFFAEGRLKRIDLRGGAPVAICPIQEGVGHTGTWSADDTILFATVQGEGIFSVPSAGGSPTALMRPDPARNENRLLFPSFLPDGKRFLYLASSPGEAGAVMMGGSGAPVEVVRARSNAAYIDAGYLLFAQDSTLVAQRFDPATGRLTGEILPVANPVNRFQSTGITHFSASRSGAVIVFQSHGDEHQLAWFDRSGNKLSDVSARGSYLGLRLSADDQEAVFARMDRRLTTTDVWTLNFARGNESKLTNDPGTEVYPIPVGKRWLIYSSTRSGPPQLMKRDLVTGTDERFASSQTQGLQTATDVSPDGQWIFYNQRGSGRGTFDIVRRHISDGRVEPYLATAADEGHARLSPDGRFVAFVSDQTGTPQINVAPFPEPGLPRTVSVGASFLPRWSREGREILYLSPQGVMAVPIHMDNGSPSGGKPVRLFGPVRWNEFDVARDGRLLAVVLEQLAAEQPLTAIVNWPARPRHE